jgi:hypothetical protein
MRDTLFELRIAPLVAAFLFPLGRRLVARVVRARLVPAVGPGGQPDFV